MLHTEFCSVVHPSKVNYVLTVACYFAIIVTIIVIIVVYYYVPVTFIVLPIMTLKNTFLSPLHSMDPCICYEQSRERLNITLFFILCRYSLKEINLSSCLLTQDMLLMLGPAFRHTRSLKWDRFILQRFGFAVESASEVLNTKWLWHFLYFRWKSWQLMSECILAVFGCREIHARVQVCYSLLYGGDVWPEDFEQAVRENSNLQ